ncbi:zinc-binding dehydrogenase [Paraburkholderia pallida]|uniref:Alcohol dehydrogenase-like C-terminal domain-containing protein n=1 Tax=Paraburkholderia pallida TaxID=2547399 RepID=A0A4P7CUA5_9BURK|nr:zinc-binding dehydrogenase [Paraburkholderia pallida]QBQ98797.1 hypothetical protein E1956_16135 [Paraburkholderia pallida]
MRGMVFQGDCKVEVLDFEDPVPGYGEAVIEMKASGMCGTDLHYYRHGMADSPAMLGMLDRMDSEQIIGGHEPCGVIAALGPGVDPKAHGINASKVDPVEAIRKLTGGKGVSCAVECAGGELPRAQAIRSTGVWGRVVLVAIGGNVTIDVMKDLIGKQRTLIGSFTFSETGMKDCARFIADHGVEVDQLFTEEWSLEQAGEAYAHFNQQTSGKGIIVF